MRAYWKGIAGDEHLWQHEWSKHGTCVSTLEPRCYGDSRYRETEEVVDYFAKAVELFGTVSTYQVSLNTLLSPPPLKLDVDVVSALVLMMREVARGRGYRAVDGADVRAR
jgi:Ribonuclease T2 family